MSDYPIADQTASFDRCINVQTLQQALREVAGPRKDYNYWASTRTDGDHTFYRFGLRAVNLLPARTRESATDVTMDVLIVPRDGKNAEWFLQSRSGVIGSVRVKSRAVCQDTSLDMLDQRRNEQSIQVLVAQVARELQDVVNAILGAELGLSI